ncbi:MAG: 50S ribosomal protein L25 [Bacteroidetes bacterium]|nr:50S ribosomal protein L25 [Bacteroidota bacterium]
MSEIILKANIREYSGRSDANAARREGKVPGVFYLKNEKNIPIEVEALELRPLVYTSESRVVDLQLNDGTSELCILRDVQFDPITDKIVHFDLMGLIRGQKVKFDVPVLLEGSAVGVKAGGVLTQILHKVEVECLPKDLPQHISVDISHLEAGQSVTVADLQSEGIEILTDPEQSVAIIGHARAETETPGEEEGLVAAEEPEVIAKGKDEEEA